MLYLFMDFLNGVFLCSRGYPRTGEDAVCFCPRAETAVTHHPSRHISQLICVCTFVSKLLILFIFSRQIWEYIDSTPPPNPLCQEVHWKVTMNINNYECLLLARNELGGWTLYHQNNLIEWVFIPIVLMRNWDLVVLISCLRSHGNNSSQSWPKPDSAVRVFHRSMQMSCWPLCSHQQPLPVWLNGQSFWGHDPSYDVTW